MNFSNTRKFSKFLSLLLVVIMVTTLSAGCRKTEVPEESTNGNLNLNLSEPSDSTGEETTEATTAPVINENTATVTSQINIRSSPSTEATIINELYAGDKVEISRREVVTGIDWAYIISPEAGWIVMDHVEMDIPSDEPDVTEPSEAETTPGDDDKDKETTTTNIKGVINANGLNIRSEASTNGKIQGTYNKGDVVTILETKNGWGRTSKGWIKLEYVSTTGSNNSDTNNNNDEKDNDSSSSNVTISGNGSTTVILKGIVTASELNVRADADQSATRVGSLKYGARVEIYEKNGNWGRTKNGWISLGYVYQDGTTGTNTGSGTITGTQLNIRSGPGTGYGSVGSYKQGDRVAILEQFTYDGITWGCTNKGWISLQYVQMDGAATGTDSSTETTTTKNATITADGLNIRSGAGTNYDSVGTLNTGDRVAILSTTVVDNVTWGQIDKGWISMAYVKLD